MTGYGETATSADNSRTGALRARLPGWARRWDSRWLIAGTVAAVFLLCCCCGGVLLLGRSLAGDSDGDDAARPTSERSSEPAIPDSTKGSASTSATTTAPSPEKAPKLVTVPAVVGKNAAVAEDELKRAGFTKIRFSSGDPDHRVVLLPQNWQVEKQSAVPGSNLEPDAVFVLTCRKLA